MEIIEEETVKELCDLRRKLHRFAELSGKEKKTVRILREFIQQYAPDEIIKNIGGTGIAFVFGDKSKGKSVMIRSELDALPIDETNDFEHKSEKKGVAHKCGHDGHMTMVAGLAPILHKKPLNGRVILLFQPAEETGEGALEVLKDSKFEQLKPDFIFALHNTPGYPKNSVVTRKGVFAAASKGIIIELFGKTSHAGEPEYGLSPALALSEIVQHVDKINNEKQRFRDLAFATTIHMRLGEVAFGTTPGYGVLMFTLRAYLDDDLEQLCNYINNCVEEIAQKHQLTCTFRFTEEFPATVNNEEAAALIDLAAKENKLEVFDKDSPFRWSEDFGQFTQNIKGGIFGLGAGNNQPPLHHPDYDFPDEIISAGVQMFYSIIKKVLK